MSPLWPRANGAVESIMKKLKRVEAISKQFGIKREQVLKDLIRVYRDTPHSSTKVSPSDLMFNWGTGSSGLPRVPPTEQQRREFHDKARVNDAITKAKMIEQYNTKMHAHVNSLAIGMKVLVWFERNKKADTHW